MYRTIWKPRPKLAWGLTILSILIILGPVGQQIIDESGLRLGSGPINSAPSGVHPLGTDTAGRDLLTLMIYSITPTLRVGLLAAVVSTFVGALLGTIMGYRGGVLDMATRSIGDVLLSIPSLMILIVIASFIETSLNSIALIIAIFILPWSIRTIRAQVLTLREHGFVKYAIVSGQSQTEIIFLEIMPNLVPFIAVGFIGAVSEAILTLVGLQLLGLGPTGLPTLGSTLHFAFASAAIWRGIWWWWLPPTMYLIMLFVGLFLVSTSLDEFANPRLNA